MYLSPDIRLQQRLKKWALYLIWIIIFISVFVLIGWQFDIEFLKRPLPRLVAMNPTTAGSFILLSVSFLLVTGGKTRKYIKSAGYLLSFIVLAIGICKVMSFFSIFEIPVDSFLFADKLNIEFQGNISNRMAPNTAACFVLGSTAVLLVNAKIFKTVVLSQYLGLAIGLISLLSIIGYIYQVPSFYGVLKYIPMAVHTSICFFLFALSVLFIRPGESLMREFTSSLAGSITAHLLIPFSIIVPILLGYLRLWGNWEGIYSNEFGVAIFVLAIIIIFLGFVTYITHLLNKRDLLKQNIERELLELNKNLESKILERTREITDYKYALDQSCIVAITDQKGIIKYANENFSKISKYPADELIGKDHRIINSSYHPKEFIRNLWVTIANGNIWRGELKNKAKDGTIYWVDTTIVPFLNEQGKPYQYVAIRADITQRKLVEEQIQQKSEELLNILSRITDGFISLDKNFCYTYSNKKIEEMTGMSPEYLYGKNIWDLFPDVVGSETYKAFTDAFKTQEYISNTDYYAPFDLWQENHIYPSPEGISVFIRDISIQKKAEKELHRLNEELEDRVEQRTRELETVNKELESFSYSISHDLRAPLRAINGYTLILKDDYSDKIDDEGKRLLNIVMSNAKRMGTLIDDLLAFSRLGRKDILKDNISMSQLVEKIITNVKQNYDGKEIEIKISELPDAYGDLSMIMQVWTNLIDNAIKYSSRKENITIKIDFKDRPKETVYMIEDNGAGFDMQYMDKLFGVFQRLHREDEFSGTGVGLAIVKKIIVKHGGDVWAESKLNEGSKFSFTLPKK